jgi:hypothetical protein
MLILAIFSILTANAANTAKCGVVDIVIEMIPL